MLLDLMMPGLDGCALLSELSKSSRLAQIPTVLFSAGDCPSTPWPNVRAFLQKPVHVEELLAAVTKRIAE